MLLLLAAALYLLPDGAFHSWQLYLRGAFARLQKAPDPQPVPPGDAESFQRDLLDILAQKNAEIADLHRRLRELGASREAIDKVAVIPARVVRLGPDNNLDAFTIDAGTTDGVAPGQAVAVGRSLVGVVVRSEANASLVLSLASPGCYISARLGEPEGTPGRPRTLAAVQGVGGGQVRIILFSSDAAVKEGWLAMTSGLEKEIPEGMLLGSVASRLAEGVESGTMEAELRPAVELDSLDFVAVIARK